jgi:hypothetical protein
MINKNKLYYSFFSLLDGYLSKRVALLPYQFAFKYLRESILVNQLSADVWVRNSVRQGNFVFGLSDLDISIYYVHCSPQELDQIRRILSLSKKIFPFLGEANFYNASLASQLIESANYYESQRDPELLLRLPKVEPSKVDGIVFLLRMLYSDRENLFHRPWMRKSKWLKHLASVGESSSELVDFEFIITLICRLINLPEVYEDLCFLKEDLSEPEIFFKLKPKYWKYLYPHRHLWFGTSTADDPSEVSGTILGEICIRQIDWEIWGLMTQLPVLKNKDEGLKIHLERLVKVANLIRGDSGIKERVDHLLKSVEII